MKRFLLGVAALVALSACSGSNPFVPATGGSGGGSGASEIPAELAGALSSFTYDPVAKTLTVRGFGLDDTPFEAKYTRKPALDRNGYEAYTSQDSSLARHTTAYVKEIDGARAGITVSGPQFGHYFGGSGYGRDGAFDPPDTSLSGGIVTYAGRYVGLRNAAGSGEDLLPVAAGTAPEIVPTQAAEVTGEIIITADFADSMVEGLIYKRVSVDTSTSIDSLELAGTAIDSTGSFTGTVTQNGGETNVGTYGGIFGGTDASAVAGTVFVSDHITGVTGAEEYGLFVLSKCGTAGADPVCTQPTP